MKMNFFYLAVIVIGFALFALLRPDFHNELSFYGFAESNQTEINYNYPVVVDKIHVKPGQAVEANEVLLHLSRRKSKERLQDQSFKINELKAEEAIWKHRQESEILESELTLQVKLSELDREIHQLKKELAFKESIVSNLNPDAAANDYTPTEFRIDELKNLKMNLKQEYNLRTDALKKELRLGLNPYRAQINRLEAEMEFEESQKYQEIIVKAPNEGLIGNIFCKEEEHVPSYKTLLTFYEPHSGLVHGYVHEDLTLQVNIGDQFKVSSLKDENITYTGIVTGLGSRIVEIPARLRKIATVKSYGREVLIEIPKENDFLQKEKLSITHISDNE